MPFTSDQLLAYLAANGIAARTEEHAPVFTVAESQALGREGEGAHTKNLFLRDGKKRYFLVTLGEHTKVDLKALRSVIGARGGLSFATHEALYEHLGILPGSVSPLAVINDAAGLVTMVIEDALLQAPEIHCHPLVNSRTSALTPSDLLKFLALTGHEPLRIDPPGSGVDAEEA